MPELKIGIVIAALPVPLRRAFQLAGQSGADAVEIEAVGPLRPRELSDSGVRQLRKLIADEGLCVAAVRFPTRRGYNVLEDLDARIDATKAAMQLSARLGARIVTNHVGRVPEDREDPAWGVMLEALSDLAAYGQHVGVQLVARTGSETGTDLARLLDALPSGGVGVDFDPGGLILGGYSPAEAITALGSKILYVHARDSVRDLAAGRGVQVPLGRGSADFPELAGMLEQHQYRGFFTIDPSGGEDPIGEISRAVQFLRSL
ncbi:MAG: TIM barrel protein [Planctomycetes bacterium]|nr:TIM barrel protein [Planctomycetota bacterium]